MADLIEVKIGGTSVIDTGRNALNLGTVGCGAITTTGSIIPSPANTLNLGSAVYEWANLYVGTGKVYFGTAQEANLYLSGTTLKTDDTFDCAALLINGAPLVANSVGSTLYIYFNMRGM